MNKKTAIFFVFITGMWCFCHADTVQNPQLNISPYIHIKVKAPVADSVSAESVFLEAAPQDAIFVIENKSSYFLIVRKFEIKDQLPDIMRWYGSYRGDLQYDELLDRWAYNELAKGLSKSVFSVGVIAPGATLEIPRPVCFKKNIVSVEMTYHIFTVQQAAEHIYISEDINVSSSVERYFVRKPDAQALLQRRNKINWSFVIIPELDRFPLYSVETACRTKLKKHKLSLEDAKRKLNYEKERRITNYLYWPYRASWVFTTDAGTFFINEKEHVRLGEIELLSFIFIEFSRGVIDTILPLEGYEKFNAQKPYITVQGKFNPGVTPLLKKDVCALLEFAHNKHDRVWLLSYDPNGLGEQFYLAVGEFDEPARREFVK